MLAGVAVVVRDKYAVRLALEQREELRRLIRVGKHPARVTARARILLKSDDGWPAPRVAEALDVSLGTVYRFKQRFTEEGLAGVLKDPSPGQPVPKVGRPGRGPPDRPGLQPAAGRALPLDPAPAGWQGGGVEVGILHVPRRGAQASQKNALKPWQKREWRIPRVSAEFVANMEDLLDHYSEPYDTRRPVVCFDETMTQ